MADIRRFKTPDGYSWAAVRDWLQMIGLHIRPNGKPDTNTFIKKIPPGFVRYEAMRDDKGKWVVVAFAIEDEMIRVVEGVLPEEEPTPKAPADPEMTVTEFFKLTGYKRSAILNTDKELRQIFFANGGVKLRVKSGLALFPSSFLETVNLESAA